MLPPAIDEYLLKSLKVSRPPLTRVEYSPVAFTLIAHLIERLSGTAFLKYIQENIFDPLEMKSSAFIPTADMDERFAIPYVVDGEIGRHVPVSRVRVAIWPTGQVYGTVRDLSNWLIANLNGGVFQGRRIIGVESLSEIHTRQYEQFARTGQDGSTSGYGLGWNVISRGDDKFIAHSGSLPGETAYLLGNITKRIGVSILTNGNRAHAPLRRIAFQAADLVASGDDPP